MSPTFNDTNDLRNGAPRTQSREYPFITCTMVQEQKTPLPPPSSSHLPSAQLLQFNTTLTSPAMYPVPSNGYDLLSSLVSPGPATPIQPDPAWPGLPGWETPMQSFFSQAMQFPGTQIQFSPPGFLQNAQQDFIPLGGDNSGDDEEDAFAAEPEISPGGENTALGG